MAEKKGYRTEKDSLGKKLVPIDAYYGIQTLRAFENFPVSGLRAAPPFIAATAMVKLASARANASLGLLDKRRARAMESAASEVIAGRLHGEFIVDVFQAGAGTSHNMNANEVIANRAIEVMGGRRGDYSLVHPNDHVNMSQSTNDVVPTALRLAAVISSGNLLASLERTEKAFRDKSKEFSSIIKSGRTHLQDAVPVTLGQEFGSYATAVKKGAGRLSSALDGLKAVPLGATAVGTGINTHPRWRAAALKELGRVSGIKGLAASKDTFEALAFSSDFAAFSSALRLLSTDLVKISNDLRLLSSGPKTGLAEISLPAVQPGSSIMPGKINPVMAEMLSMVCFHVMGSDHAVSLASGAGQLELNVMTPVIAHNLLGSIEIMTNGLNAFTYRCLSGVKANRHKCAAYFENSAGLATALNVFIGYEKAAQIARESLESGRSIREIVVAKGIMTGEDFRKLTRPENMTRPVDLKAVLKGGKRRK